MTMEPHTYWKCRNALHEAHKALELVTRTDSWVIAAAACRRALEICLLLDREIHQTVYPADLRPTDSIACFQSRHPALFSERSARLTERVLAATGPGADRIPPSLDHDEERLENVYLPAARSLRLMLDEVASGLRRPRRHGWRFYAATAAGATAAVAMIVAVQWARMMASTEGLTVTYFRGMNMEEAVARRVEKTVAVDYGERRPAFGVPRNGYSARWEGTVEVPVTTNYLFYGQCDGGIRVLIDNDPVIDNWHELRWRTSGTHGSKVLEAGDHTIVVEHFKNRGKGAIRVRWAGGPIPDNTTMAAPYLKR